MLFIWKMMRLCSLSPASGSATMLCTYNDICMSTLPPCFVSRYPMLMQISRHHEVPLFPVSEVSLKFLFPLCTSLLTINSSGRFRGGGKNGGSKSPGPPSGNSPTSPTGTTQSGSSSGSFAPRVPPLPNSPSLSSSLSMNGSVSSISNGDSLARLPNPKPLWLNDHYAKHIVKGNFMTLSARPKTVEQGEWIAHQGTCVRLGFITWLRCNSQLLSIIKFCGTSSVLLQIKRRMVVRFAMCIPARECQPACKLCHKSNTCSIIDFLVIILSRG